MTETDAMVFVVDDDAPMRESCSDARYSRKFSRDNYDGNVWLEC
jgi:FixJ family two-component response regulator